MPRTAPVWTMLQGWQAKVTTDWPFPLRHGGATEITCYAVTGNSGDEEVVAFVPDMSDARLISAALEMYDLLREMESRVEMRGDWGNRIRRALSKVEGG